MEELCGLVGLDWEERQAKAEQILKSNSWKQDLCNELQGLSFRDLEAYLQGVATERQKKEEGYERKLAKYNEKRDKPLQRNSTKSTPTPKAPPRSLAEILEQVHAPRVEWGGLTPEERKQISKFLPAPRSDEIPRKTNDDDN